jgi:hypothetical protein
MGQSPSLWVDCNKNKEKKCLRWKKGGRSPDDGGNVDSAEGGRESWSCRFELMK